MKKFLPLFIFILYTGHIQAQDLIVTIQGDTLNCRMIKQEKNVVHFAFRQGDEIKYTQLPIRKITRLEKDYFHQAEVPEIISTEARQIAPNYRIALDGSWTYYAGDFFDVNPLNMSSYKDKLTKGYNIRISAQRFFEKNIGLGVTYSLFRTSHSDHNIVVPDLPKGYAKDDISIHFAGPTANMRFASGKRNTLQLELGVGYLGYKNQGILIDQKIKITSHTAGYIAAIGYDFGLSEKIAIGLQISAITGTFDKIKYSSDDHDTIKNLKENQDKEGPFYFNFSLGLRFKGNK